MRGVNNISVTKQSQLARLENAAVLFEAKGFKRVATKEPAKRHKMPSTGEKVIRFSYPGDERISASVYGYSVVVYRQEEGGRLNSLLFKPTHDLEAIKTALEDLCAGPLKKNLDNPL